MSDAEQVQADRAERLALARLETAVAQVVEEHRFLAGELREARKRLGELEAASPHPGAHGAVEAAAGELRPGDGGAEAAQTKEDAAESTRLRERVRRLEGENASLRQRVSEGLETVESLLSRLDSG